MCLLICIARPEWPAQSRDTLQMQAATADDTAARAQEVAHFGGRRHRGASAENARWHTLQQASSRQWLPPYRKQTLTRTRCRFDSQGNPTHDADGAVLPPKAAKKAAKDADALRKPRDLLSKRLKDDPHFMSKLQQQADELQRNLTLIEFELPQDVIRLQRELQEHQ